MDRLLAEITDESDTDFSEGDWYDEDNELHAETVKVHGVCMLALFREQGVMRHEDACAFLSDANHRATYENGELYVRVRARTFDLPEGHLCPDVYVLDPAEYFATYYKKGYRVSGTRVRCVCPCGLEACAFHVIPSTVRVQSAFPLEIRTRKGRGGNKSVSVLNLLSRFRAQSAMTFAKAAEWWQNCGLNVRVRGSTSSLEVLLHCRCGNYHATVPCALQQAREMGDCVNCHRSVRKSTLTTFNKKYPDQTLGLCQQCRVNEMIHCKACDKRVRRQHNCKPLCHEEFRMSRVKKYPPIRRGLGNKGVCPDCQEVHSVQSYARHQARAHWDLRMDAFGNRMWKKLSCYLCAFSTCDSRLLHLHEKTHLTEKTYKCDKCTLVYSSLSALHTHRRTKHFVPSLKRGTHYKLEDGRFVPSKGDDEIVDI